MYSLIVYNYQMRKESEYTHLEPFFGTPHIDPYTALDLQIEVQELLDVFFKVDGYKRNTLGLYNFEMTKLLRIIEILKFGKNKYPYLLSLDFKTADLKNQQLNLLEVHIWRDPHYDESSEKSSALQGNIPTIANLIDIKNKPTLLTNSMRQILINGIDREKNYSRRICLGGTKDVGLIMGIPRKEYFVNKNPIYSIHRPLGH